MIKMPKNTGQDLPAIFKSSVDGTPLKRQGARTIQIRTSTNSTLFVTDVLQAAIPNTNGYISSGANPITKAFHHRTPERLHWPNTNRPFSRRGTTEKLCTRAPVITAATA